MTPEYVRDLLSKGETSSIQFKSNIRNEHGIAQEMVAFSNAKGGTILIGVDDKTWEIVGLSDDDIRRLTDVIVNASNEHVKPPIFIESETVRLMVFDNRIEIISPGSLPNSLVVEELRYGNPVVRNNLMVGYALHTMPYRRLGSGLKRAYEHQPNIELINDTDGELFRVIIPRPEKK